MFDTEGKRGGVVVEGLSGPVTDGAGVLGFQNLEPVEHNTIPAEPLPDTVSKEEPAVVEKG